MIGRCLVVGVRHAVATVAVRQAVEAHGFEVHVEEWPGPIHAGIFDFAIDLAGRRLPFSRFPNGVWWLEAAYGGRWPGRSAGALEVADAIPLTGVLLCGRGGALGSTPRLLCDAWFRTDPYSPVRQRHHVDRLARELVSRAVGALRLGLEMPWQIAPRPSRPRRLKGVERRRLQARSIAGWAASQLDDTLRSDHWTVGVIDAPAHRFLDAGFRPEPHWLAPTSRDVFAADPHAVLGADGGLDVYCEHFDYRVGTGELACRTWSPDGWAPPRRILREPNHLSYPFVFAVGGRRFGTAENAESGVIPLYRVDRAGNWSNRRTLIGFPGLDPTVVRHEGRWWLFATDARRIRVDALHVWYADDPTGPWTPHPGNPVKVDVRSSRCAGAPFMHGAQLHRPAQDGTDGYGSALVICRIDSLSPTSFSETVVARVAPFAGYGDGIHTLSGAGTRTVVDGKRRLVVPSTLKNRVRQKLAGMRRHLA